jgi:hypothetical protein
LDVIATHFCIFFSFSESNVRKGVEKEREEREKEPNVPLATRPDAALLYHVAWSLDGKISHPQRQS